jgi:hypothetical protein
MKIPNRVLNPFPKIFIQIHIKIGDFNCQKIKKFTNPVIALTHLIAIIICRDNNIPPIIKIKIRKVAKEVVKIKGIPKILTVF